MLNKLKNSIYKFYINKLSHLNFIDNSKLVSGHAFKKLCQYEYNINAPKLIKNSIIFVDPKYLLNFIENSFDFPFPLTAICSNTVSEEIKESDLLKLPKNIKLYLSNTDIQHKDYINIFPIPTGLHDSKNIFLRNGINKITNSQLEVSRNSNILCNFNYTTNVERKLLLSAIFDNSNIKYQNYLNHKDYLIEISKYMFVLCPPGKLIDTHRFWETIYCGAVPIVKKNNIYLYFQSLGIPMIMINDWDDIRELDEDILLEKFNSFQNLNFQDYLKVDFWKNFIFKI